MSSQLFEDKRSLNPSKLLTEVTFNRPTSEGPSYKLSVEIIAERPSIIWGINGEGNSKLPLDKELIEKIIEPLREFSATGKLAEFSFSDKLKRDFVVRENKRNEIEILECVPSMDAFDLALNGDPKLVMKFNRFELEEILPYLNTFIAHETLAPELKPKKTKKDNS